MPDAAVPPSAYRFRPHWEILPAGTQLWRRHPARFAPGEFKPFDPQDRVGGRFDGTPEDPYPCLYAAQEPETALAETLLRSVGFDPETNMRLVPWAWARGRSLSVLRTRCELKLVSLRTGAALAAVRQDSGLLDCGPEGYPETRRWAREIRVQAPEAAGLVWDSKRNRSGRALVLFGDRCADLPEGPLEPLPYRNIPDLGSPDGIKETNQILELLSSAVREPLHR
ncbi:RES family NAD+ phosphorylase [Streptomyces aculeolatus]